MKTLLRIDSSIRHTGSISRAMGDHFVAHWKAKNPKGRVIARDLQATPVPHLTLSTVLAFLNGERTSNELTLSDEFISEITACDELLITCPVYNSHIPSSLKAYFDHVLKADKILQYANAGFTALVKSKKCYLLTTMGGRKENTSREEAFETYIRDILGFIGIKNIVTHCVDGTAEPEYASSTIAETKSKIINSI